ncbi:hypothetical protein SAMN05216241_1055 [Limimonas halophila]|uniref:Uncharacterized protein n=1 Tax=Limimonas halophila TaxID=1082479 RepID=A0A1G7R6H4_9PROT|nr:hypothetical protein [Limimonas halophila]SDG06338.1 hypothetical protein SAMN05216241_1055 [Limimonas halophila]
MSALDCIGYFLVLTPLGAFMCAVTAPMVTEHAGIAHRALGGIVCVTGGLLVLCGILLLLAGLSRVPA